MRCVPASPLKALFEVHNDYRLKEPILLLYTGQKTVFTRSAITPPTHSHKLKSKGQSVQKIEWKQTDGQTDDSNYFIPFQLAR